VTAVTGLKWTGAGMRGGSALVPATRRPS
jgi:hypothetical protein